MSGGQLCDGGKEQDAWSLTLAVNLPVRFFTLISLCPYALAEPVAALIFPTEIRDWSSDSNDTKAVEEMPLNSISDCPAVDTLTSPVARRVVMSMFP